MRRREFIQACGLGTCGLVGVSLPGLSRGAEDRKFVREAGYYEKLPENRIRCLVCPRRCVVGEGQRGYCRVRENVGGDYCTIVYGRVCARHIDPIEKKPLFHFLPGTTAYSIATVGCNMACKFCQNWEISQEKPENVGAMNLVPSSIADEAERWGTPTIAYTYTEPTVYYEFMIDSAREGHKKGIRSVMISAGYINEDPLKELAAELDAIKVDLKAHSQDFYSDICSTDLQPVLDTIVRVKESGTWLELVNLIIPTLNDGEKGIRRLCKWVIENIGDEVPLHFTRFYPTYKLKNLPPTPVQSVEKARNIALDSGVKFAYVGNVPAGHPGESTYCPSCGAVVVRRVGYSVRSTSIEDGRCGKCDSAIPGVWT